MSGKSSTWLQAVHTEPKSNLPVLFVSFIYRFHLNVFEFIRYWPETDGVVTWTLLVRKILNLSQMEVTYLTFLSC